jgi:hypothetical protein
MTTDEIISKLLQEVNTPASESPDILLDISRLPYIIESDGNRHDDMPQQ